MQEHHSNEINQRMDELLARLKFDIEKQPPVHLPPITAAVAHLYQVKQGLIDGDQKMAMEINLLKQVTNQIKNHGKPDNGNDLPPGFESNVKF
jgi:hypothetical protein